MQQGLESADVLVGAGGVHGEVAPGHFGQEDVFVVEDGVDAPGQGAHLIGQYPQLILGMVIDLKVEVTLAHFESSGFDLLDGAADRVDDGDRQGGADGDADQDHQDQGDRCVVEQLGAVVGRGICTVTVVLPQISQCCFQRRIGFLAFALQDLNGFVGVASVGSSKHFFVQGLIVLPALFHGVDQTAVFAVFISDGILVICDDFVDLSTQAGYFFLGALARGFAGRGDVGAFVQPKIGEVGVCGAAVVHANEPVF